MQILRLHSSRLAQIICGILAVCILYNSAGHLIVLMSLKRAIRTEMKSLLKNGWEREQTEIVKIPLKSFKNYGFKRIEAHEFLLKGNMYDIISEKISGDTLIIHCINDIREKRVKEHFAQYINNEIEDGKSPFKKQKEKIERSLKNLVQEISFFKKPVFLRDYATLFLKDSSFLKIPSHVSDQVVPPPKVVFAA